MSEDFEKFLDPSVAKLVRKFKKQRFEREYVPQRSFGAKVKSDVGALAVGLIKTIPSMFHAYKESLAEQGLYDMGKSFWDQPGLRNYNVFTDPASREMYLKNLKMGALNLIPGYTPLSMIAKMPYVAETKFGQTIQGSPISSMANKLLLDSLIRGTGSWIYNPNVEGRRWFPNPGDPSSRWQLYREHPFLGPLEDITNIALLAMPFGGLKGLTTKGVNLARFGSTAGGKKYIPWHAIEKVQKLTKLGRATEPIARAIRQSKFNVQRFFKTRAVTSDIITNYFNTVQNAKAGIYGSKMMKRIRELTSDEGMQLTKFMDGDAMPLPGVASPKLIKLWQDLYNQAWDVTTRNVKKGRVIDPITGKVKEPGLITIEQVVDAMYGRQAKDFGISPKELYNMGIRPAHFVHIWEKPVKRVGKAAYPLSVKKPGVMFERGHAEGYVWDPILWYPERSMQLIRAKGKITMYGKIDNFFGKPLDSSHRLKPHYRVFDLAPDKELLPLFKKKFSLPNRQIPEYVYKELESMLLPGSRFEKFLSMTWDPATAVWKTSVLALSPRWIFNNFMGNIVLNTIGGVGPVAYIKALVVLKKARSLAHQKGWTLEKAFRKLGIPRNVLDAGLYREAAKTTFEPGFASYIDESPILSKVKAVYNHTGVPQLRNAIYRFNAGMESFFRTAHYFDKIGAGYSKTAAIKSVNEFLFQYSKMTYLERAYIRRITPFWNWQKNITRLALTFPVRHPNRAILFSILARLNKDERDFRFLQDWLRQFQEIPGTKEPGGAAQFLNIGSMMPFMDIGFDLGNLHPIIKIALERATRTQLFKGRPFTAPYPTIEGGVEKAPLPSLARHIASQFPQFRLIESMVRPYAIYDTGAPMINRKTGQPMYPKNKWMEIAKMFGISVTPYNIEEMQQRGLEKAFRAWRTKQAYEKARAKGGM